MKLPKKILEDSLFLIRFGINFLYHSGKNKTILFYPEFPSKRTILYKLMRQLRINITNNPQIHANWAIYWHNTTIRPIFPLANLSAETLIINRNILDISKVHVDKIFKEVAGYGVNVDPLQHTGPMVIKSDANARHDGQIINGPIQKAEEGYVYQIIINNTVDGHSVEDIRVPVFKEKIPFVYIKHRPINDRFSNSNDAAWIKKTDEALSIPEQELIIQFSIKIGLDYGELDILRNRDDGKIYIVDVNPTPWGPPNHLEKRQVKESKEILSKVFKEVFCK